MNFPTSINTCLRKYASFKGRASRSEYWWFYLFSYLVTAMGSVIDTELYNPHPDDIGVFETLLGVGILLPVIAVHVRRLHDIGRSGWWVLALFLTVCVGAILLATELLPTWGTGLVGLILIGSVVVNFAWLVTKGDPFENEYGPDPFDPNPAPPATVDDTDFVVSSIPRVNRS